MSRLPSPALRAGGKAGATPGEDPRRHPEPLRCVMRCHEDRQDPLQDVMKCHDRHAHGVYPAAVLGMKTAAPASLTRLRGGPFFPPATPRPAARPRFPLLASPRKRGQGISGRRSAGAPVSQSCMSFLHPVSFHFVPFSPPPGCPGGGTLIRAYPARASVPAGARIAAARFARLIARTRPRESESGRRTHVSRRLLGCFFRAGADAEDEAASGYRLFLILYSWKFSTVKLIWRNISNFFERNFLFDGAVLPAIVHPRSSVHRAPGDRCRGVNAAMPALHRSISERRLTPAITERGFPLCRVAR